MLRNKHNTGTDLEAPVVWLLLRGKKNKKERRQKGQGGERKHKEDHE